MKKFLILIAAATVLGACSGQPGDTVVGGPSGPNTAPTESAEEFIARVNDEFKEFKTGRRYPWAADRVM